MRSPIPFVLPALLFVPSAAAHATEFAMVRGRTGLPKVIRGHNEVRMDQGVVHMSLRGKTMVVTQDFKVEYPANEDEPKSIEIAVREDYYRSRKHDRPPVHVSEARGFTDFAIYCDGRRSDYAVTPWSVNDKRDTATRWRTFTMNFAPGDVRNLRIVSEAPIGEYVDRAFIQFVSKDVDGWRGEPAYLEIRLAAPGTTEAHVAGLEPRATNINRRGIRWVYRHHKPSRDVYIQLPPEYNRGAYQS